MATLDPDNGFTTLTPVTKVSLADRVANIVLRFILTENLKPGDQLPPEREMAATLGVSHRVIREVLGGLVQRGLIVKEHGRGAFLQPFDPERLRAELTLTPTLAFDLKHIHEARVALEIGCMYIVAHAATAEDIAALQAIIDTMRHKNAQGANIVAEDLLFHHTLLRATHNDALLHLRYLITESIRQRVQDSPGLLHRKVVEEVHIIFAHQAIVDAIRERDGTKATLAMHSHLKETLDIQWRET